MTQVQLRLPENLLAGIDRRVEAGEFKSRSDAIKTILALYEEREKTREFLRMLRERSKESETSPETLIPMGD